MIASKKTYEEAVSEHKRDLQREEEIDRIVEEAQWPAGGHRIGGPTPGALLRPRHTGLTSAEEHTMWLEDVSRWQEEYLMILTNLERARRLITENRALLRRHTDVLSPMIAEHEAMMGEYESLKAMHARARQAHERAAERNDKVIRRLRPIDNAVRAAFSSASPVVPEHCSVKEPRLSPVTT